jgi:hypothetical protein
VSSLVAPLKNNPVEEYEEPIEPAVDGLAARGFYPQQAGTNDEAIGVERDTDGNLVLKDLFANATLSSLLVASANHDLSTTLVHNIAATSFDEAEYTGGLITRLTTWTSSAKAQKMLELLITYTGPLVTQIISKQFNATGVLVQQMTEVVSYLGSRPVSITRVRDL